MSELFDTIGHKASKFTNVSESNGSNGDHVDQQDDDRVVDEIESLCMNCEENASQPHLDALWPAVR